MSKQAKQARKLATAPQQVKILAGQWRATSLPVLLNDDIRPTPSRVRETLFNWLQPTLEGSRCLDLFAGSGALGFEAVSRGAKSAHLIDKDPQVIRLLKQQVEKLNADGIQVICDDAYNYLQHCEGAFDIIFLDPPFTKLHPFELLQIIQSKCLLKAGGCIYVEYSIKNNTDSMPVDWRWRRQSKAGEVEYGLIEQSHQ